MFAIEKSVLMHFMSILDQSVDSVANLNSSFQANVVRKHGVLHRYMIDDLSDFV